jgi:hypothetical protein
MKNTLGRIVYAWFRVESLGPSRFIAIYYLLLLRLCKKNKNGDSSPLVRDLDNNNGQMNPFLHTAI